MATAAGVLAIFIPLELLIAVVAWFISGKTIKISSVASFIAIIALVIVMYIIHPQMPHINTHAPVFIIIFIIIYKHIPNIVRLIKGEEKRVI